MYELVSPEETPNIGNYEHYSQYGDCTIWVGKEGTMSHYCTLLIKVGTVIIDWMSSVLVALSACDCIKSFYYNDHLVRGDDKCFVVAYFFIVPDITIIIEHTDH